MPYLNCLNCGAEFFAEVFNHYCAKCRNIPDSYRERPDPRFNQDGELNE